MRRDGHVQIWARTINFPSEADELLDTAVPTHMRWRQADIARLACNMGEGLLVHSNELGAQAGRELSSGILGNGGRGSSKPLGRNRGGVGRGDDIRVSRA